jgi:uncharacterized MnhB-related membrane protein
MLQILIIAVAIICAIQALRAKSLLVSALWLAGVSALVALLLYLMGAAEVAVIELSVGAGLGTVLFVFAISIAGEETTDIRAIVPKPLAWGLIGISVILLLWLIAPVTGIEIPFSRTTYPDKLWEARGIDVLVQIVLIFTGVLGVLGLLAEAPGKKSAHTAHLPEPKSGSAEEKRA